MAQNPHQFFLLVFTHVVSSYANFLEERRVFTWEKNSIRPGFFLYSKMAAVPFNMATVSGCQRVITPVKTSLKNWIRILSNFVDDHSGHHPRCKNLWGFSLFSSNYFPWLYCVDFSAASFISIVLCPSSSSGTRAWPFAYLAFSARRTTEKREAARSLEARKSLNRRNRSLLFFASYFSARLDFPSPPPSSICSWVHEDGHSWASSQVVTPSMSRSFHLVDVQYFKSWPTKLELKRKDPSKFRESRN